MTKDEALKLAKAWFERNTYGDEAVEVYEAIEQALAAPTVQEPVVWVRTNGLNNSGVAHYGPTCPPGWVGAATAYFKAPTPEPAQKRMHPELKKLYEDFFDKCFKETVDLALDTTPPAAQPAPVQEPVAIPHEWRKVLRKLAFMARTSGGTAGHDSGLSAACEEAEALLSKLYTTPPAAPVPLTDHARGLLVVEHLGPNALLHKPISIYDAFHMGIDAAEAAHGITAAPEKGQP